MLSEVIVFKAKGKRVSDAYAKALLDSHKIAMGIAFASEGVVENDVYYSDEHVLADQFKELQNEYINEDVFFYFMNADDMDKEFSADNVQPFNVLLRSGQGKEDDVSIFSVMLDIDYSRFAKGEEGPESSALHLMSKYLGEKIRACYKQNDANLETTAKAFNTEVVKAEVLAMTDNRADILFIPAVGKAFAFADNNLGRHYTWGYATKHLNVETDIVAPKEPAKVVDLAVKPPSLRDRKKGAVSSTAAPPKVDDKKEEDAEKPRYNPDKVDPEDKNGPGATFKIIERDNQQWVIFTTGIFTHAKNAWNRNTLLPRPSDEKAVKAGFPAAALKVGSPIYMYLEAVSRFAGTPVTAFREAMSKAKKLHDEKLEAKAKTAVDDPLIIGSEDRKKVIEIGKDNGMFGYTLEQIKEEMKEVASFTEQTGQDLEKWKNISTRGLLKTPKFALVALINQIRLQSPAAAVTTVQETKETAVKPKSLRDRKSA